MNIAQLRAHIAQLETTVDNLQQALRVIKESALNQLAVLRADNQSLRELVVSSHLPEMQKHVAATTVLIGKKADTIVEDATKILLAKYRYEVHQRKILFNKIQELKG